MADRAMLAVIESSLAVAWSDGDYCDRERALIEEMVQLMPTTESARGDAVRINDLWELLETDGAREYCYQRAVIISLADKVILDREREVLERLADALKLTPETCKELEKSARSLSKEEL